MSQIGGIHKGQVQLNTLISTALDTLPYMRKHDEYTVYSIHSHKLLDGQLRSTLFDIVGRLTLSDLLDYLTRLTYCFIILSCI